MKRWVDSPAPSVIAAGGLGGDTGAAGIPFSVAERPLSVPADTLVTFTCRYIACAPAPFAQALLSTAANGVTAEIVRSDGLSAPASRLDSSSATSVSRPSTVRRRRPRPDPSDDCAPANPLP